MSGLVRSREQGTESRRLVLGFDAGCLACSHLARRIEERVGDKLELRSLGSPQVQEWRKRALGEDAPWAPTLIELKGPRVRAWTGPGMAVQLGRFLGPVASWRVMQILGESGAVAASERLGERPVAEALARAVSRGQFLKGAGGVVAGAAVLAGFGWVPLATKNGRSTAQAQTQEPIQGCEFKEPAYSYRELTKAETDTLVRNNRLNNPRFARLLVNFRAQGYTPRPDAARAVSVTYTTSGGSTRKAYDLRIPFERVGQQYPVLGVTRDSSGEKDTSMAVFQRVAETDQASRVDVYRSFRRNGRWRVRYTRSWQGPFPLAEGAPVAAREATPPASELIEPDESVPDESVPDESTAEESVPDEESASERAATYSSNSGSCEDCGRMVEAIAEYECGGVKEIGCGLVCFEPDQYVDLSSCEPQCGAAIAAVCAAGVPANEGTACQPFCDFVVLTGDELVRVAREKALTEDVRNVSAAPEGPGSTWPVGLQTGEVFRRCRSGTGEDDCATLICHDPLSGDCASSNYNEDGVLEVSEGATAVGASRRTCADGKIVLTVSYQLSDARAIIYSEWENATDESYSKTKARLYKYEDGKMRSKRRSTNGQEPTPLPSGTSSKPGGTASNVVAQYEDDACGGCCSPTGKVTQYNCYEAVDNIEECVGEQCGAAPIACGAIREAKTPRGKALATAGCFLAGALCSDVEYDCCASGADECTFCNFAC